MFICKKDKRSKDIYFLYVISAHRLFLMMTTRLVISLKLINAEESKNNFKVKKNMIMLANIKKRFLMFP